MSLFRHFYLTLFALIFCLASPAKADKIGVAFVYQGSVSAHGWTYQHDLARQALEKFYGDKIDVVSIENQQPGADAERLISGLARKGNAIIFITSPALEKTALEVAKRYPDVYFEIARGTAEEDNVSTYDGRFYEARYILGQIAAQATNSKTLGYIAPSGDPHTSGELNAFVLGAQSIAPDISVVVAYSGADLNLVKEAQAARDAIAQGADVLAFETNTPAPAQVAEQNGVKVFGNAADMSQFAPQAQLTSIQHDWSGYYIKRVGAVIEDKWTPAHVWAGFREGIVTLGPFAHLDESVRNKALDMRQKMIDGTFRLFTGPIFDKDGTEKLKANETASDDALKNMNWLVKGNIKILPTH